MGRGFVRFLNGLVSLAVGLSLLIAGAYAGYCLWDNHQIYAAAENVQDDMIRLKPKTDDTAEEQGPSFAELLRVNQDVKAWLTLDHTQIDYPVLQGEDNFAYINTDVYGNFALAGSIFIDSRCDPSFADPYTLLHGHHMENSRMFGDLDLYKELDFFRQYYTGTLIIPGYQWPLRVFACMVVPSSEKKSSILPFGKRMGSAGCFPSSRPKHCITTLKPWPCWRIPSRPVKRPGSSLWPPARPNIRTQER